MKKILLCCSIILIFVLTACSAFVSQGPAKITGNYTDLDLLPRSITITPDAKYVLLLADYSSSYFKLSLGDSYDDINVIYDAGENRINNYIANDKVIAWSEHSDNSFSFKYYDYSTKEINEIRTISYSNDLWQLGPISVFDNIIYFMFYDYETNEAFISSYDTINKTETIFLKDDFVDGTFTHGRQFPSMDENQGYLSISKFNNDESITLLLFSLKDGLQQKYQLPDDIALVYASAVDIETSTVSVYYYDRAKDKDCLGIYSLIDDSFKIIKVFHEYYYVYHDEIQTKDGFLYFVNQMNVSGEISDHYSGFKYDIKRDRFEELKRCFSISFGSEKVQFLSFDIEASALEKINYGIWE